MLDGIAHPIGEIMDHNSFMPIDHLTLLRDLKGDSNLTALRFHYGLDHLIADLEALEVIQMRVDGGQDVHGACRPLSWRVLPDQIHFLMKIALQENCRNVHENLRVLTWQPLRSFLPIGFRMKSLYLDIQCALDSQDPRRSFLGDLIHQILRSEDYCLGPQSSHDDDQFYEVKRSNMISTLSLEKQSHRVLSKGLRAGLWDGVLSAQSHLLS